MLRIVQVIIALMGDTNLFRDLAQIAASFATKTNA
jgi:hypothetical protein